MSRLKSLFCCCRKKTAWAHATRCSCQTNVIFHIIFHPTQPMLLTAPVKQTSYSTSYSTPLSPRYSLLLSNKHHIPPHSAHATHCSCQTNIVFHIIFHPTRPTLLFLLSNKHHIPHHIPPHSAHATHCSCQTNIAIPPHSAHAIRFSCQTNIIFRLTQPMPLASPVKQT